MGIQAYEKASFKPIGRRRGCRVMGGEVYVDRRASEFESPPLREVSAPDTPRKFSKGCLCGNPTRDHALVRPNLRGQVVGVPVPPVPLSEPSREMAPVWV